MVKLDFAALLHIKSEAAAIIFAVAYFILSFVFLFKVIRGWTATRIKMLIFCLIRVTAFILRALLASVTSVADNEGVFIAYSVLFNIGFYALLDSAYSLVIDREDIDSYTPPPGPLALISRIVRQRRLIHIACVAAVALGITAAINSTSSDANTRTKAKTFRTASVIIFLVVTALLAIHTFTLAISGLTRSDRSPVSRDVDVEKEESRFGARHDVRLLAVIVLLLLVREAFLAGTLHDSNSQNNEALWYPLVALPEVLVVSLFAVPGLLPTRAAILEAKERGPLARR